MPCTLVRSGEYLKELAGTDEFLTATNGSIRPDRMADRECILRFLAFYVEPWETYSANSLDDYLIEAMTRINEEGSTFRDDLSQIFRRSMKARRVFFTTMLLGNSTSAMEDEIRLARRSSRLGE